MSRVLGTECFHVFFDGVRSATRRGGAVATATRSRSLQECSSLLIRSRRWHKGRSRGPPAQAEQWASEFEHLPDHRSEITRVWLASKLRMDAFPRTERLIYERTLKRDLDFASQWHAPQPPSPHPSFVPVRPMLRRYSRRFIVGGWSATTLRFPLT